MNKIFLLYILSLFLSCNSVTQPKPKSYLRLKYLKPIYKETNLAPNFSFEYNTMAQLRKGQKKSPSLVYPEMKATLYINYNSVSGNIDSLLNDAYKLPYKHISKAESIPEKLFINRDEKVYGTLFSVIGNAASQFQFFLTDSINHFIVGSLYFYARPNYDSLYPAVTYLQKDIIHIMETLQWN